MITGFHIEPTNICSLKCPGCARTDFIKQWSKHWKNHSLDIDQLDRFLDIDLRDIQINLCGNYGDPIYHPRLVDLVARLKSRQAHIKITTNGSHRSPHWWQQLADVLTDRDEIIFSIDGLPTNFTKYRINADWSSIQTAIDIIKTSQAKKIWKFIIFNYNQDDITSAQTLSKELGFDQFVTHASDRWNKDTEQFRPTVTGPREAAHEYWNKGQPINIDPKCAQGREHFISATGRYIPCCFVADHRFYYKTIWNHSDYDITRSTLSQILHKPQVVEWYNNIQTQSPSVCQFSCPK